MENLHRDDLAVHGPRLFRPAYFAGEDVVDVGRAAFNLYYLENALYSGTSYPSLHRYESEIIEMLLDLLHAPEGAGGSVTSGGTESNLMAVKTARDWARARRPDVALPEIVVPETAHPSFTKAESLLGVKVVRLDTSVDYRADVEAMADAITDSTIMLVGSAPPFAYGVVDPIREIASLAMAKGLRMHVDCCLGGMLLPFAATFDESIPAFDFGVPGVSSISVDLHKYGYAVKGISSILFSDGSVRRYQEFVHDDPIAGYYSTPNIAGTRPGGAIASAWAVMQYLGSNGYAERSRALLDIKRAMLEAISGIDGLTVLGRPHACHFNMGSASIDIRAVGDGMEDRGWSIGRGGKPPSIWLMLNMSHRDVIPEFASDLAEVVELVKSGVLVSRETQAVYAR